jgi:inner membrane transporter RhtA
MAALLGSMASLTASASFAKQLFGPLGAAGTTTLRVGFAAALLLMFWRPWRIRWSAHELRAAMLFGFALGAMNLCFYLSLRTVPLGVAIALEFSGPLAVAVMGSRRPADFIWIALAVVGVGLLLPLWQFSSALDPAGVGFALAAGVLWAAYILLGQRAAKAHPGPALALAMTAATVLTLPFGIAEAGSALLQPNLLVAGLALAVLSSALPYSLEMFALGRLPAHTFGILLSLEPALGALSGLLFLGERLNAVQLLAIACVIAASGGTALASARRVRPEVAAGAGT